MYIFKNALRCIARSKGRNVLIGIIVLVIAVSACIGLSIRQAAESTREKTLSGITVTGTISLDRQSMMENMGGGMGGGFDRDHFASIMGNTSGLSLSEYQTYATAASVKDFYYILTASLNGSEAFEPFSTDGSTEDSSEGASESQTPSGSFGGMFGGTSGNRPGGSSMGDFTVIGYSGENAMTDFVSGVASITDGTVFEEGTHAYDCLLSEELALYNGLSVGDTVLLTNPANEEEAYTLTVVGLYTTSESADNFLSGFGTGQDPANKIYMSAVALQALLDASEEASETVTDENTGRTYETAIGGSLSCTYVFADADAFARFEAEARALGLDESYTVSSSDLSAYESSLVPLNTLSTMAGWFLLVVLAIGAVILVVLNLFNVRERKYEIGVLTAIGMKKGKVALQFMTEILVVTMVAVLIGAVLGAVSSVPVTNALLADQVESQQNQSDRIENNFGRGERPGGMGAPNDMPTGNNRPMGGGNRFEQFFGGAADYVTEIDSAMNLTVVLQMIGIGILLTLISGAVSVLFVMRYEPLKILANRD